MLLFLKTTKGIVLTGFVILLLMLGYRFYSSLVNEKDSYAALVEDYKESLRTANEKIAGMTAQAYVYQSDIENLKDVIESRNREIAREHNRYKELEAKVKAWSKIKPEKKYTPQVQDVFRTTPTQDECYDLKQLLEKIGRLKYDEI